jgi:hypothetical protein
LDAADLFDLRLENARRLEITVGPTLSKALVHMELRAWCA